MKFVGDLYESLYKESPVQFLELAYGWYGCSHQVDRVVLPRFSYTCSGFLRLYRLHIPRQDRAYRKYTSASCTHNTSLYSGMRTEIFTLFAESVLFVILTSTSPKLLIKPLKQLNLNILLQS